MSVIVIAIVLSSYGQNNSPPTNEGRETVTVSSAEAELGFELHAKFTAVLLRVNVNSKPAVMILDTGSSRTILSPRIAGLDVRQLHSPVNTQKGSGIPGDARWGKATLQVGPHVFRDQQVVVLDLRDVSSSFGQEIDGLLGQDMLCQFDRVIIDFKNRRIVFDARR